MARSIDDIQAAVSIQVKGPWEGPERWPFLRLGQFGYLLVRIHEHRALEGDIDGVESILVLQE